MIKFFWPVKVSEGAFLHSTNTFGANPNIYAQFGLKGHNGLDFIAFDNSPVYASHDGDVIFRQDKDTSGAFIGFGNYARITNADGATYYAHLKTFEGQDRFVRAGEVIGHVDSTGFSTGPHLHFGFRPTNADMNNGYGGCVDPLPYLAGENEIPYMPQFKTQNYKGELRVVLQAASPTEWDSLCKIYGLDPKNITETVN